MYLRFVILLTLFFVPISALAQVEIVEVMCNPVGSDTDGEWVKIKNNGTSAVDITGWKFNDGSNHGLNVPPKNGGVGSMSIETGAIAHLARDASKVSLSGTVIDTAMALNNTADELSLIDDSGATVSTYTYTSESGFDEGVLCIGDNVNANSSGAASSTDSTITPSVVTTYKEVTKWETVTIQPPEDIYIRDMPSADVLVGSTFQIYPEVYDATGAVVKDALCDISFGDGAQSNQCNSTHIYNYIGDYIVVVSVQAGALRDSQEVMVRVTEPQLQVLVDAYKSYVEIVNNADKQVELHGWSIKVGHKRYVLPVHTKIVATGSIKLSESVLKIDLQRYGGVAELMNALGKTVANSAEYTQAQPEPLLEALSTTITSLEQTDDPVSVLEQRATGESVNAVITKTVIQEPTFNKINNSAPTRSIIGVQVKATNANVEVATGGIAKDPISSIKNVTNANADKQIAAAAATRLQGASATSSPPLQSKNNDTMWQWLVGVLALVGLAAVPILFKGADAANSTQQERGEAAEPDKDSDDVLDADSFTIKEVT